MKCGNIIASTKNDQHSSTNDRNSMFQNVGANTSSVIDSNFSHFCKSLCKDILHKENEIKNFIKIMNKNIYYVWNSTSLQCLKKYEILFQQQVDKLIDQARFPFYI